MKAHKILFIIILFFPYIAGASINLGTIQTDRSADIYPGEIAEFKILLFSMSSVHISFSYELPEYWTIEIDPEEMDLPPESGEYVYISGGYIIASPVYIKLKVPLFQEPGEYNIKVIAQAASGDSGTIVASQERIFTFKIRILNDGTDRVSNLTDKSIENLTLETGNLTTGKQNQTIEPRDDTIVAEYSLIWIFAFIVITLLAIIYIKH